MTPTAGPSRHQPLPGAAGPHWQLAPAIVRVLALALLDDSDSLADSAGRVMLRLITGINADSTVRARVTAPMAQLI